MSIGFAGLSHLGIVSSVAAASKGHEVVAYDPDEERCRGLEAGRLPIVEPGLPELCASSRSRWQATSAPERLRACEVIVCSADVPTTGENRSDVSSIDGLIETVVAVSSPGTALVVLSQVPPGFTRRVAEIIRRRRAADGLQVYYQVETLIFGRAVERALQPERFIVGCQDPQRVLPPAYAGWLSGFGCPILTMRYESAELAKIAINRFLVSSVCTTNTLAELCEAVGADWSEIVPALKLDRRIGPHAYLSPGLGLSGGNVERDLMTTRMLAKAHGTEAGLVDAWLADSRYRREWVLRKLHAQVLGGAAEPVVALWGLAYKAGTASTKNAPAQALLEGLRGCRVRVYDPAVSLNGSGGSQVTQAASALEACRGADALVIMAPWPEFATISPAQAQGLMRGRIVLDPYGVIAQASWSAPGCRYARLGTPSGAGQVRGW